jgi:cytochrome b561
MSNTFESAGPVSSPENHRVAIRNTANRYGVVAVFLHWLVAIVVVGLFILGAWMTDLTYYDEWYRSAPDIHKSIGILLFITLLIRMSWRIVNVRPDHEPGIGALQRRVAEAVHWLLYLLLFALMISGYLISTADGKPIEVFGVFSVPATISDIPNMEDVAGKVHWYLALVIISLASLHAIAALKHHFFDRDRTLTRMLGIRTHRD